MAFEQSHYLDKPFITSYVSLLCSLVNTKEDAELLEDKRCIFREQVSDEEVVNLVKGLSKYVVPCKMCYLEIVRDLNRHCNSDWKNAMGTVRRVYFRDAWRGSSTIIGIVVLIFTIFGFYLTRERGVEETCQCRTLPAALVQSFSLSAAWSQHWHRGECASMSGCGWKK
ncbi:hypothetical protein PIB30_038599 [Stylosanthes scabra]|uniref:Uncharacterized protein n=1 Tax=Stylosanthes scabra TaxID=79078 RepID=A0ABU6REA6_9FABA|nr:hypothetical protein [Stylosanthes scabra]